MGCQWKWDPKGISRDTRNWALGLLYIVAVATIWIAASYLVQSVVDAGVSPFLLSYICNSLFLVYIPIIEVSRYFEKSISNVCLWCRNQYKRANQPSCGSENAHLLEETDHNTEQHILISHHGVENVSIIESRDQDAEMILPIPGEAYVQQGKKMDPEGRWTRYQVAKVSLLICPFWFFAQLTFNLSLKYTTVTVGI